tara:strand:- start:198 stop:2072 length:1875 start_codon:yes stop_codon:yes gene_type:complete
MNNSFKKESPLLSLPSLGGGSHSTLVRKPSGGGGDPTDVSSNSNAPLSFGIQFTIDNGNYITWVEFQNNGSVLLLQNIEGEWKYDLSTPYDISSSSVSYKSGSARYWTIGQYTNNALSGYRVYSGRVMRFDYNNDKAYFYGGDGTTKIIEDLDVYTQTAPTLNSSSSNPFPSPNPGTTWNKASCYVKKSGGGVAFAQLNYANQSNSRILLRNYANNTTVTVSSWSVLNLSSIGTRQYFTMFLSTDGTTISVYCRNNSSGLYETYKWTLSTPFDLSTAGTATANTNAGIKNGFFLENGVVINDHAISGKLIGWSQYGYLTQFNYTVDGDVNNATRDTFLNRADNGCYHNGSSYGIWHNEGKQVIDQGYSSNHFVYDSTSNPYGWKFHNISFGNRSSGYTQVPTKSTNEGQTFSDGRFNGNRSKMYSSFYSSTYEVSEGNLTTPGDITTLVSGSSNYNSKASFTGWSGGYSSNSGWYDKLNNKYHLADFGSYSGTYYIFDLNASGEFTGTYTTTPTGFSTGDLYEKWQIQPLSHNGKYFAYHSGGANMTCHIILLDHAFEPARGYTEVHNFAVEYNLPNGTKRSLAYGFNRMYVSSGRIFFAKYYYTTITAVFDVTIMGKRPDKIT